MSLKSAPVFTSAFALNGPPLVALPTIHLIPLTTCLLKKFFNPLAAPEIQSGTGEGAAMGMGDATTMVKRRISPMRRRQEMRVRMMMIVRTEDVKGP